jgi:hypothetical protein
MKDELSYKSKTGLIWGLMPVFLATGVAKSRRMVVARPAQKKC